MISILGERIFPNIFQIWTAFRYLAFFVIGYKIRQYGSEWLRRIPMRIWLFFDVIIFVITQILTSHDGTFARLVNFVLYNFTNIWGSIAFFLIAQSMAEHIRWKESMVFFKLGKVSMPIYLFHQQIIYFSIRLLNGQIPPVVHMIVNFCVSISVSFAIASLLLKHKATKFLIGEK